MAMSSLIRKASPAVVPFGLFSISTPRILIQSLTMVLGSEKFVHACTNKTLFSTAVHAKKLFDQTFVQVLESEIQSAKRSLPAEPTDFCFEIEDEFDGRNYIKLKGEFLGEKIEVLVNYVRSVPLQVKISKKNGGHLKIWVICGSADDDIIVKFVKLEGPKYAGTASTRLLQKVSYDVEHGLKKFMEIRGINRTNVEFLRKYMDQKYKNRNIKFLCKLEEFIKS